VPGGQFKIFGNFSAKGTLRSFKIEEPIPEGRLKKKYWRFGRLGKFGRAYTLRAGKGTPPKAPCPNLEKLGIF